MTFKAIYDPFPAVMNDIQELWTTMLYTIFWKTDSFVISQSACFIKGGPIHGSLTKGVTFTERTTIWNHRFVGKTNTSKVYLLSAALTTCKKMQKKLLIICWCSLQPNFLTLQSMILMQRNLLVAAGCLSWSNSLWAVPSVHLSNITWFLLTLWLSLLRSCGHWKKNSYGYFK